ncbi:hypothetical protein G7K_4419-t1 [Saitoella complicata NRRL Y-17804]|uniref:Uncharacterized protein n=1 Tax=Saitoella complicata (strain BCRC 22490 / CBS 7301 / JCM 7358 / NBRC 10748 / NRRL Y-17804) TaxID=698492 RepID=A0A0E9NKC2_SAICN|nr:hypothetical protein G7K_4419-t1 [Saitoella complicata NRRL Y-17804]
MAESNVLGIAFGNSNSSIAYINNEGKADCIANEDGDRQIPSILAYSGDDEYHGFQAKAQLVRNRQNTVANFRDFIGKSFADIDPTHSAVSAHPVDTNGTVSYDIPATGKTVSVSELATRHLLRLKQSAEDYTGRPVTGAVLTVPTDFTHAQRDALIAAAKAAELNVLQVINEPVAALLATDAIQDGGKVSDDKTVVVVDLGGTRCDASVIASRGGMYTVLATAHDYDVGGNQLDDALVDFFGKEFEKKTKVSATKDERSIAKLVNQCEVTKKTLSASTSATVSVESLAEGVDFHSNINRMRYELLGRKVFDKMVALVQDVVKKAHMEPFNIDEVIMVGGTSHTPKLASRLSAIFPETTRVRNPTASATSLNPAELNCLGAAVQASLIADFEQTDIEEATHAVVTSAPHIAKPIGVLVGDEFVKVIDSETAVPARRTITLAAPTTPGPVYVAIYEGERDVKVTPAPPRESNNDEEDSDYEEEEPEDFREPIIKPSKKIAECVFEGEGKGKVEVTVQVDKELQATIMARAVGGKEVVRGVVGKQ